MRPRPAATFPPPLAIRVLGPAIILLVAVVGMSQLAVVTGSLPRRGELAIAMAPSPRVSPLLGVPSAPATVVEPTHLVASSTAVEAVIAPSQQAQPALAVVAVVLRRSTAPAAPRTVAPVVRSTVATGAPRHLVAPVVRSSVATAAPRHPVAPVVIALLRPSPAVVAAKTPVMRVRGKSRLQHQRASVVETSAVKNRVPFHKGPTSPEVDRTA